MTAAQLEDRAFARLPDSEGLLPARESRHQPDICVRYSNADRSTVGQRRALSRSIIETAKREAIAAMTSQVNRGTLAKTFGRRTH